jgi:hypothetical protein
MTHLLTAAYEAGDSTPYALLWILAAVVTVSALIVIGRGMRAAKLEREEKR